jgi:hypothetical protein
MKELSLEKIENIKFGEIDPCLGFAIGTLGLVAKAAAGPAGGLVYLAFVSLLMQLVPALVTIYSA